MSSSRHAHAGQPGGGHREVFGLTPPGEVGTQGNLHGAGLPVAWFLFRFPTGGSGRVRSFPCSEPPQDTGSADLRRDHRLEGEH